MSLRALRALRGSERSTVVTSDRGLSCCEDHKKMTVAAAMFTMLFSSISVGLLINDLIEVNDFLEKNKSMHFMPSRRSMEAENTTADPLMSDEGGFSSITLTKVLYTALVCLLVLLMVSSVALLKGLYQKKQSLLMAWMLIVLATAVYTAIVLIRDFQVVGQTSETYAKCVAYVVFLLTEFLFMRHVVYSFREVRAECLARERTGTAVFDPRNPDNAIFSIMGGIDGSPPTELFKLPSYQEAITDDNNTGEGTSGAKPPPYEPPTNVTVESDSVQTAIPNAGDTVGSVTVHTESYGSPVTSPGQPAPPHQPVSPPPSLLTIQISLTGRHPRVPDEQPPCYLDNGAGQLDTNLDIGAAVEEGEEPPAYQAHDNGRPTAQARPPADLVHDSSTTQSRPPADLVHESSTTLPRPTGEQSV